MYIFSFEVYAYITYACICCGLVYIFDWCTGYTYFREQHVSLNMCWDLEPIIQNYDFAYLHSGNPRFRILSHHPIMLEHIHMHTSSLVRFLFWNIYTLWWCLQNIPIAKKVIISQSLVDCLSLEYDMSTNVMVDYYIWNINLKANGLFRLPIASYAETQHVSIAWKGILKLGDPHSLDSSLLINRFQIYEAYVSEICACMKECRYRQTVSCLPNRGS